MSDKSLLTRLGETVDQYRAERRTEQVQQPSRIARLLHWLVPNGGTLILLALFVLAQAVGALPLASRQSAPGPSATTVNYQGRLADDAGVPLDGTYGMSFALYSAATGGVLVWGPEEHTAVPVSGGLFSVGLGSKTSGGIPTTAWDGDRYLEITVGSETLSPRELIRSVPIAGMALTVPDGAIGTSQIADGAVTQAKAPALVLSINGDYVKMQSGTLSKYTAGTYGEDVPLVNFASSFSSPPRVILTNCTQNDQQNWDKLIWSVKETSATGFRAHYQVGSLTAGTYKACWLAIGQ